MSFAHRGIAAPTTPKLLEKIRNSSGAKMCVDPSERAAIYLVRRKIGHQQSEIGRIGTRTPLGMEAGVQCNEAGTLTVRCLERSRWSIFVRSFRWLEKSDKYLSNRAGKIIYQQISAVINLKFPFDGRTRKTPSKKIIVVSSKCLDIYNTLLVIYPPKSS
jgi:hypothetical protein